jgi:CHAT domain-containing protein
MKGYLLVSMKTLAAVILCALVASCQSEQKPVVSLDQARQLQAQLQGQTSFVPPPRTISDITAVLSDYKPDEAKLSKARQEADEPPSPDLTPLQLVHFLYSRGQAAGEIGRRAQQLEDVQEAARLGAEVGHPQLSRILLLLESAAAEMGNNRLRLRVSSMRFDAATNPGQRITALSSLARSLISVGRLDEARLRIDEADKILASPQFNRNPRLLAGRSLFERSILLAKSLIAGNEGRYDDAERLARETLAKTISLQNLRQTLGEDADGQGNSPERQLIQAYVRLASVQMNLGKLIEAEAEARNALIVGLKAYGRYAPITAGTTLLLAQIICDQGRYAEAGALTDNAIEVYRSLGTGKGSVALAQGLMLKGRVQHIKNDSTNALASFDEASSLLAEEFELHKRFINSNTSYGAALLAAGKTSAAVAFFERTATAKRALFGDSNYATAEARGYLGAALAKSGNRDRALTEFAASVPILLQASRQASDASGDDPGDNASPTDRDRQIHQILEAYIELLSQLRPDERAGIDPAAESFRLADAARARGVQRALSESAARSSIRDPALAVLVRQDQDAQKQVNALFGLLSNILNSPAEEQDAAALQQLRERLNGLRHARGVFRNEIERRFPDYNNLIEPQAATVADVQSKLRPGEAMLSIYVGREESLVWAIPRQGPISFATVALIETQIAAAVAHLRQALDPNAATLGDIPTFDVVAANRLYSQIVQPVAAGLAGADSLIVVPDKALGQLPFGLLVTQPVAAANDGSGALFSSYKNVPFLLRKAALTQLPSATAFSTLRRVPPGNPSRKAFAGFGDPWFNPDQVREAQAESATQVAALTTRGTPARSVQTRGFPLTRRNAPATNGIDNAELAMLPRLPDTADEVRSIADALKADQSDIFLGSAANETQVKTLNLADRKVVMFATHGLIPGDLNGLTQPALALSAPTAAQPDGDGTGAEAASGLGLAFFYAGTRAVLLTNWPVETTSARTLTTDLFRRQAADPAVGRAKAMRQAMMAMIDSDGYVDQGAVVFSYAHPIFWAPFSVMGDGDGGNPGS